MIGLWPWAYHKNMEGVANNRMAKHETGKLNHTPMSFTGLWKYVLLLWNYLI